MKKFFLTSLLAVFAASGAHAANVIDGNPLYMPKAGHFASVTSLESHSKATKDYALSEDFSYGITDRFAVEVGTSLAEVETFDAYGWNDVSLNATFRAYEKDGFVADVYGGFVAGDDAMWGGGLWMHDKVNHVTHWMDKDYTGYTWTAGVRGGYTSSLFTVAGHVEYMYLNSEMFNWGDKGMHKIALGLDGQFVIDQNWNLVGGVEYTGVMDDKWAYNDLEGGEVKNAGQWDGYLGVNYNIDATKFVGLYVNGSMDHQGGDAHDEWHGEPGFGFGARFGIDF